MPQCPGCSWMRPRQRRNDSQYESDEISNMELQGKPDFEPAMKRIDAWFAHEMIDRPPVRFAEHNSDFAAAHTLKNRTWPDLRARWFDAEFQVDYFLESIRGRTFHGETFPVFSPNLGTNVYAAFHGAELDYGEVTSWIRHCVHEPADVKRLQFSRDNVYFQKIEELTRVALQKCAGKFMVGYTDLHGSLDCACLLYTSPSPRDRTRSRMPSSA